MADQSRSRSRSRAAAGELGDEPEHAEVNDLADLRNRAEPRVEQVGHERNSAPSSRPITGPAEKGRHRGPALPGGGRVEDLGADAAVVAHELRLLELVHDRVEQRPLPLQVVPQVRLGKQVDLGLLALGEIAAEAFLDLGPHRFDRLQALLDRTREEHRSETGPDATSPPGCARTERSAA